MSQPVVVIDPGHGGTQPNGKSSPGGAPGPSGLLEKEVNLALARRVASRLAGGATPVTARLTRDGDTNPSLAQRALAASDADVFLSLHANGGRADAHGSEVYWHAESNGASQSLATSVSDALARCGLPQLARRAAALGVLHPKWLGTRAAGCLVEIDYLSNPMVEAHLQDAGHLDAIAAHVAEGIQGYLVQRESSAASGGIGGYGGRWGARYGDGENYFTDTEDLTAYMRDQRAADTTRVSTVADAEALVDGYIARGANTVWNVDANRAAAQIRARCADHRLFQQGNLNLCGPAAFLMIWAGRDPVAYARFALALLESGRARLGSETITPNATLLGMPYPRFGRPSQMTTPAADFVCMASLRNDANVILPYDPGSSMELLAASTLPGEVAEWLRATGIFSSVRDEANWTRSRGIDHALELMPGGRADVAVLLHVNALASATSVENAGGGSTHNPTTLDNTFLLSAFPNHFVILLSEVVPDTSRRTVSLSAWTWAGSYVFEGIPVREFSTNYYGAVKTHLR